MAETVPPNAPRTDSPVTELRQAAARLRGRVDAVGKACHTDWGNRPWAVTSCVPPDVTEAGCECIVYQGEYKPYDEPQVPIQYVADAESKAHAAYIAGMHPGVALAVADWLQETAGAAERNLTLDTPECPHADAPCPCGPMAPTWGCGHCGGWIAPGDCTCWTAALAVARAVLGGAR